MEASARIGEIRILAFCSALALIAAPATFIQMPFVSALLWLVGLASGVLAIAMWVFQKRFPFSGFVEGPLGYKAFVTVGVLGACVALIALAIITYLGVISMLGIAVTEHVSPPGREFAFGALMAWVGLIRGLIRARRSAQSAGSFDIARNRAR
jgi:hypothetical protein